jgi:hypothetical protein
VIGMTPATGGEVDELLEARLVVAGTHHARQPDRRRDASAAEPRCRPQIVRTTVRHPNPNFNPDAAATLGA